MAYRYEEPRSRPTRRHTFDSDPPVNHTTRSWSNNGVRYTVETASYSRPNISIGLMGGTARSSFPSIFDTSQPTPRTQSGGLLGTAFGLLGNVLAAQQQATIRGNSRRSTRRPSVDDLAYREDEGSTHPQSFISKFAERLLNNSQRSQRATHSRSQRAPDVRRSKSYRTEPSWTNNRAAYVEDFSEDEDDDNDDEYEDPCERKPRRTFTASDISVIEALQNAAEHHRRQAKKCRERIQQTSRQPMASTAVLQGLLNELKGHEAAYESALQNLELEKEGVGSRPSERKASRRDRHSGRGQTSRTSEEDIFGVFSQDDFRSFFEARQPTQTLYSELDDFDAFVGAPFTSFHRLFNEDDTFHFFGMPRTTFSTRSSGTMNGTRAQRPAGVSTFAAPRQSPPAALIKPEETQRLFKTYNDRWNALGPTDPGVPYPARGLQSTALLSRDSIWAPLVHSPVADWSNEAVMQANAQAFFLGVVGLASKYTEAPGTGRIVMGFNNAQASAAQVKGLIDMLKKEKIRWHSDRLGRRNGGMGGPNEALQCNEKARAVFHAVCELMEVAQ